MGILKMNGGYAGAFLAVFAVLLVAGGAVADASKSASENVLTLGAPALSGTQIVVPVTLTVRALKPSAVSFRVTYDAELFEFKGATRGAAATAANKYVEAYETAPGSINFMVWAFNSSEMDSGVVLTAAFSPNVPDMSANDLFLVGSNLSMSSPEGVSLTSQLLFFAPETVTVTAGSPNGVLVEWTAVPQAAEYVVLRSSSDDPSTVSATSDSLPASQLSFLDDSDEAVSSTSGECKRLYYWVAARSTEGMEGSLSESALWSPGTPGVPANVSASTESGALEMTWSAVADAAGYRVYRGVTKDSSAATAINQEFSASELSYSDGYMLAPSDSALGCFKSGTTYYYWVRAVGATGCESDFSASVSVRAQHVMESATASVVPGVSVPGGALGDLSVLALAGLGLAATRRVSRLRRSH